MYPGKASLFREAFSWKIRGALSFDVPRSGASGVSESAEPYPVAFARYVQNRKLFEQLRPGDRVAVDHEVKVGFRRWHTRTEGTVVRTHRVREGLHYRRNWDDKAFADQIVLRRDDGELTTVTLDEYSRLELLQRAASEPSEQQGEPGANNK